MTTAFDRVTDALTAHGKNVRGGDTSRAAQCPAHDDSRASLSVTRAADRVLVCCHTGCDLDSILTALDLQPSDLFDEPRAADRDTWSPYGPIVAAYDYVTVNGTLLFQVCRTADKQFPQRRPDRTAKSGWNWKLGDTQRVLYRLPQVLSTVAAGDTVFVVEGEKDVHALEAAGYTATCNPGGAGKWRHEYAEILRGADVVVVCDRDKPGRAHGRMVEASLRGVADLVRLVEPRTGKDTSDHLAAGHTVEELELIEDDGSDLPDTADQPLVVRRQVVDGATFILDAPTVIPALWGGGDQVAWAAGESLLIAGPAGVGKTTLAQQLVLARIGVSSPDVLGMPVVPADKPVLYIAADRPPQVQRSFARMVTEEDRELLRERLIVWQGPPPFDLMKEPASLSIFAQEHGAGTLFIDSLKDIVLDISKDESGSRYNLARQQALAAGIDIVELHHQRKDNPSGGKPKKLNDVYGSVWIPAGAGSVFVLWGEAGDPIVELIHLKQPQYEIGPHKLLHDAHTGTTTVDQGVDLLAALRDAPRGLTAYAAATLLFGIGDPKRNDIEKARRRLDSLVRAGLAHQEPGAKGGATGGAAALWYATPDRDEEYPNAHMA